MIELRHITKTFPMPKGAAPVVALDDVSLTIEDGEIFGIIGLSGAGKSTLVRCINLLERPDAGEVLIDGVDLTGVTKKELLSVRRGIGMIFQHFNLLEQRTVIGNVIFPLEIAGVPRAKAKERAEKLLDIVGLSDRAYSYPSRLSGGQKQRVAIARALATEPKYLLCDEATSALDPNTTGAILALLRKVRRELGVTVVIITHEMEVIDSICNRVAVMDRSRVVEVGPVSEVFKNPQSAVAKELVLPKPLRAAEEASGIHLRLVFNGAPSTEPIISRLILDTGAPLNILFANMKEIDGRMFGQTLLTLPAKETAALASVETWLRSHGITYTKEV